MVIRLLIIFTIFLPHSIFSQQEIQDSINSNRLLLLSGITAGTFIYAYGVQNDMWWKGERSEFHTNWSEDWNSSLGADKIGHFYFGQSVATIYNHAFKWVGYSNEKSVLYSGLFAFSYQTFLEIRDGFSRDYGFSWGDFGANLLGSMYPYLQYRIDLLKNFNFKVSYWPSERFKNNSNQYILDDYESTYHWLSIDINYWLPSEAAKIFPDFINLGIGHSVTGLDNLGGANHEFYIGLDWDLEALPGDSGILKFLKDTLNLYHFPSPAVKIYPNIVWYGLRF